MSVFETEHQGVTWIPPPQAQVTRGSGFGVVIIQKQVGDTQFNPNAWLATPCEPHVHCGNYVSTILWRVCESPVQLSYLSCESLLCRCGLQLLESTLVDCRYCAGCDCCQHSVSPVLCVSHGRAWTEPAT